MIDSYIILYFSGVSDPLCVSPSVRLLRVCEEKQYGNLENIDALLGTSDLKICSPSPDCRLESCVFLDNFSSFLNFNAAIATKVVCFSRLLKCLIRLYGKQCGPRSTLFAAILNSSVMLGSYLQETPSADNFFRCIFFLAL